MAGVLAMILAGGEGTRLQPLTVTRSKPSVPFGGSYRLIDFVLNNFVNSDFLRIYVLTQFKSQSLYLHMKKGWNVSGISGRFIDPIPAQMRMGKRWYDGTADAIYQNLGFIELTAPDHVCIFGSDHIYKMDIRQMLDFHKEKKAVLTVAAIRVPIHEASKFGIIEVDDTGKMIGFEEKPREPKSIPGDPLHALASMGNYIFTRKAFVEALNDDAARDTKHDMGGDIAPYFASRNEAGVYDFNSNEIPGSTATDHAYWRDVGTIKQFYDAHMDLIAYVPEFNLYNQDWPIYTMSGNLPPAKFVHAGRDRLGHATDSIVSPGVIVSGGEVHHSVLSPNVRIHSWAQIVDSVLFDGVVINRRARVYKAILDKNVVLTENSTVGIDTEHDLARGFTVTPDGITVVPKNTIVDD